MDQRFEAGRISEDDVPAVRRLFEEHGYTGPLHVVDHDRDEAVFLVPGEDFLAVEHRALTTALQDLLG